MLHTLTCKRYCSESMCVLLMCLFEIIEMLKAVSKPEVYWNSPSRKLMIGTTAQYSSRLSTSFWLQVFSNSLVGCHYEAIVLWLKLFDQYLPFSLTVFIKCIEHDHLCCTLHVQIAISVRSYPRTMQVNSNYKCCFQIHKKHTLSKPHCSCSILIRTLQASLWATPLLWWHLD